MKMIFILFMIQLVNKPRPYGTMGPDQPASENLMNSSRESGTCFGSPLLFSGQLKTILLLPRETRDYYGDRDAALLVDILMVDWLGSSECGINLV